MKSEMIVEENTSRAPRRSCWPGQLPVAGCLTLGLLLVVTFGCLGGCDRQQREPAAPAELADENTHDLTQIHSPWYLTVDGSGPFRTVTFKDVGMNRSTLDADDPLLEVIAESLAMTLASRGELGMSTGVEYDASLIDPDNHTFCGRHHLYIDLWRGDAPARWGYSLWSGCNEHDQFVWQEFESPIDESLSAVDEVAPLTEHIAASLRDAMERGCYRRHC